eukprot:TRINITY_DN3138_c0_g1_i1.p1 TRINITY_DN3138_c0_g1~~TRINITY_DN3138_c0_g1_i1.p1  ORF type:complete len:315 (+),score=67.07 TRINITY_DN3138_c0_g1_i1:378-1322(+)
MLKGSPWNVLTRPPEVGNAEPVLARPNLLELQNPIDVARRILWKADDAFSKADLNHNHTLDRAELASLMVHLWSDLGVPSDAPTSQQLVNAVDQAFHQPHCHDHHQHCHDHDPDGTSELNFNDFVSLLCRPPWIDLLPAQAQQAFCALVHDLDPPPNLAGPSAMGEQARAAATQAATTAIQSRVRDACRAQMILHVFKKLSNSRSRTLDFDEFCQIAQFKLGQCIGGDSYLKGSIGDHHVRHTERVFLSNAFAEADEDGDGLVDETEFLQFVQARAARLSDAAFHQMITEFEKRATNNTPATLPESSGSSALIN